LHLLDGAKILLYMDGAPRGQNAAIRAAAGLRWAPDRAGAGAPSFLSNDLDRRNPSPGEARVVGSIGWSISGRAMTRA
jgi:hypothetical protein